MFGIACSAALISNIPKKGSHRCYISSASSTSLNTWFLSLSKGARTREGEDYVCSRMILNSILSSSNLSIPSKDYLVEEENEQSQSQLNREEQLIDKLYRREIGMVLLVKKSTPTINSDSNDNNCDLGRGSDKKEQYETRIENQFKMFEDIHLPPGSIVYPGSFNPLHEGHIQLVRITLSELGFQINQAPNSVVDNNSNEKQQSQQQCPVVFEIAVVNADKPPLSREDLVKRLMAFSSSGVATQLLESYGLTNVAIVVTSHPLFVNKINLFPNCRILLGADTLSRLLNEKYYNNSRESMIVALGKILQKNTLIVGGRVTPEGEFVTAENIILQHHLPVELTQQILNLPESAFRCDISSTTIRNMMKNQSDSVATNTLTSPTTTTSSSSSTTTIQNE